MSVPVMPGVDSLTFLSDADVAALSPSALVDAVIASEKLLAHVNALQVRLLAELGRPQRCGDVTRLVAALVGKAGRGRDADGEVHDSVVQELTRDRSIAVAAAEVAAVLDWSPITAKIRIEQSVRLMTALPKTLVALAEGRVDIGRTRMIVDRTAVLTPEVCAKIEKRILSWVKGRSRGRLETLVDREVIIADPDAAENRQIKARQDRGVTHRPDKDGMGVINALLPAEAAVMVFTLIDLIAEANKGLDSRTVDQRRADAIADIADELLTFGFVDLDGLIARVGRVAPTSVVAGAADDLCVTPTGGVPERGRPRNDQACGPDTGIVGAGGDVESFGGDWRPNAPTGEVMREESSVADKAARLARAMSRHGRRPHLNITGALSTFAGLDELPGHLDGHGVITAELLRSIGMSWGTLTTVGVDAATGTATSVGALTYRPRQRLSDQVITLSGTCRTAGCRMPAWRCDIDHIEPFSHAEPRAGGKTSLGETIPACRFHHLLKHHTNWTPHLQPDLSILWTTNTGHLAVSHAREFTLPGEWLRREIGRTDPSGLGGTEQPTDSETRYGATVVVPASPEGRSMEVMVGPTVAGPTIPVRPAGNRFIEPHTELEDPASVPHPGSMEIHAYRAERQHVREHLVRRIRNIRVPVDPDRQAKGGDMAGGLSNIPEGDLESETVARSALIENWRAALHRSDRPTHAHGVRPPSTPTGGSHHTDQTAKLSLPDEPPF